MRIVTFLFGVSLGSMALALAACGGSGSVPGAADAISRDTFIQAYLELRIEGLRSHGGEISIEARDLILEEVGVSEEELLAFVDYWGTDPEMMEGVWEEVDSLMRETRQVDLERESEEEFEEEDRERVRDSGGERTGPGGQG